MRIACVLLLVSICAPFGWAQSESLLIGPGDGIHIQVLEATELTQTVRVMDSGEVPLIIGGEVKVAGLTPEEAAAAIAADLKDKNYLVNPHVSVAIEQFATQQVTILGEVKAPGKFTIETPQPLVSVLAQAGGLQDVADRNITIQRRVSGKRISYFVSNNPNQELDSEMEIFPGDTIIVPRVSIVYVLGAVGRPGGYPMATNDSKMTLLQAMALAGSTPPQARLGQTRLIRKQPDGRYVEIKLSLGDIQKGKTSDIPLQADDIIYVPFSYLKNAAMGLTSILSAASAAAVYTSTRP